ncbi:MAG: hypothetical protein KDA91_19355 [Planctomycetaceae bacterium]|nr:hypothetical protein [Planctomycetaceae bacterium]
MANRCVFLGNQSGIRECPTCQRSVKIKVFQCGHPSHSETTIHECRDCPDFQREGERGFVVNWEVAVTTAPRERPTLVTCVESLRAAGWGSFRIFAEPKSPMTENMESVTHRPIHLGAWSNWYLSLTEMYLTNPKADAYLICQDDTIFSAGLRGYLENHLWPAPQVGVVSIYCPQHYEIPGEFGFREINEGWGTWGALAYVFSNRSIREFLSHELPINHRHHGPSDGSRNVDSVVGHWCRESQRPYYIHTPSLAQHIGATSTLWSARATGRRRAQTFLRSVAEDRR